MNPRDFPDLYNRVLVGGQPTPGVCKLSGFKRSVKWDVKDGGGQDGASTTRKGKVPSAGTVTVYLVDAPGDVSEQDQWQAFSTLLQIAQDKAIAYDVYHPDLMALKITACVITDVGQVEHDQQGGATASFSMQEYLPPKKKPASKPKIKSSGTAPGQPGGDKPDPNAARQAVLDALIIQASNPFA